MDKFLEWTKEEVLKELSSFNLEIETWPVDFQRKILGSNSKPLLLEGCGYIDELKKINIKYTSIYGSNLGITTLIIYPINDTINLPIFAVEWVVIAEKIHLLVLDVVYVENAKKNISNQFRKLQEEKLKIFPLNKEIPDWYIDIMGPHTIYGNSTKDKLGEMKKMFKEYLKLYGDELNLKYKNISSGPEHEKIKKYKIHHYLNSPAKRILTTDTLWVDDYLKLYHFGPAYII
ncbi:hypothetical protein [Flavobacterium sp. K5-23]|uniref:hypothetical protein n=1 Tax=Flavobacterium sp. K5-23 TaxID=2746225 RepID=UPI0020101F34|nr:hypothetical protein [Flavobacterium sp. K5-23]UQD56714.1 hypothetical protein FLAK523_10070 [Flavobacterium sp. K5-23]